MFLKDNINSKFVSCVNWCSIIYWGSSNILWFTLQDLGSSFIVLESLKELKSFGWEKREKKGKKSSLPSYYPSIVFIPQDGVWLF